MAVNYTKMKYILIHTKLYNAYEIAVIGQALD